VKGLKKMPRLLKYEFERSFISNIKSKKPPLDED